MTVFFDLNKLEKLSNGNDLKFISIFYTYVFKRALAKNISGTSFLINPEQLLKNAKKLDTGFVIQYIKLAAHRDYALYKYYNTLSLDLSFFPDINLNVIKYNPLLKISDNKIYFLYEEKLKGNKNGIKIW